MCGAGSLKSELHLCQIHGHGRLTDLHIIYSFYLGSEPVQRPKYWIAIIIFLGGDPLHYLAFHLIRQDSRFMSLRVVNQTFNSVLSDSSLTVVSEF